MRAYRNPWWAAGAIALLGGALTIGAVAGSLLATFAWAMCLTGCILRLLTAFVRLRTSSRHGTADDQIAAKRSLLDMLVVLGAYAASPIVASAAWLAVGGD